MHALHPWTAFVVVRSSRSRTPASPSDGAALARAAASPAALGIVLGLVAGKVVGITGGCWIAMRLGAALPPRSDGVSRRHPGSSAASFHDVDLRRGPGLSGGHARGRESRDPDRVHRPARPDCSCSTARAPDPRAASQWTTPPARSEAVPGAPYEAAEPGAAILRAFGQHPDGVTSAIAERSSFIQPRPRSTRRAAGCFGSAGWVPTMRYARERRGNGHPGVEATRRCCNAIGESDAGRGRSSTTTQISESSG